MPVRSIKLVAFEVFMIVLTMSVVGHLTVNFWERYFIKSELAQIKESLYILKNTLFNIGNAYDILHMNLKSLTEMYVKTSVPKKGLECKKFKNTLDRRRLHDIEVNALIDAKYAYTNPQKENTENLFSIINTRGKVSLKGISDNHKVNHDNHKSNDNYKVYLPSRDTNVEQIDFYSLKNDETRDIMTKADLNTVTKNTAQPVKVNVATMTRNSPRSIGAGASFATNVHDKR